MDEEQGFTGISVGTFTLTPIGDGSFCLEDQRTGEFIAIQGYDLETFFLTLSKEVSLH